MTHGLPSPLWRLTLPHVEARELMRLLSLEGVDGASMFPGPDGVVKAMREAAIWGEPTKVHMTTRSRPIEAGLPGGRDAENS